VSASALPPARRRLEIDVHGYWAFPLDGPPSTPGGELDLGYTWKNGLGLSLFGGVEADATATQMSIAGPVSVATRRLPVGAELHFDLRVRGGALRFAAGPMIALWLATPGGVPHPSTRVLTEPGARVRVAYRLDLGRFTLAAGVTLDALFTAEDLSIGGAGTVARTSLVEISPYLSGGLKIF
jgi:hypothetical protein